MILFYPVFFVWEFYYLDFETMPEYLQVYFRQIWPGVIVTALALFISSSVLLKQVKKEMFVRLNQDAKRIRNVVVIFCFGFLLRLILSTIFSFVSIRNVGIQFTVDHITYFTLCQLLAWLLTELWPIIYLLSLHYRNFKTDDFEESSQWDGEFMSRTQNDTADQNNSNAEIMNTEQVSANDFLCEMLEMNQTIGFSSEQG